MADGRGRGRGRMPVESVRRPESEPPPLQGAGDVLSRIERANPTGGVAAGRGRGRGRGRGYEMENRVVTLPCPDFVKFGNDGSSLELYANYFEVTKSPDIILRQYHVDFIPALDDVRLQKALLREHNQTIGQHIFNGTELWSPHPLSQPYELTCARRSDGMPIRLSFRFIKEVHPQDDVYKQILNIILRKCLGMMDFVRMRDDFFDKEAAMTVNTTQREKLQIWPGYLATIKMHETKMLLNVDFLSKVIRTDTVADEMNHARQGRQFDRAAENALKAKLVGQIVMTTYNSVTYRIDDIDFETTAMSTFAYRKENRDITFKEYYRINYNINIQFEDLPVLVSKPTQRARNRGDNKPVQLIPELCVVTGITDDMRKNFHLMRDIVKTTRANPGERVDSLMKFMNRMKGKSQVVKELTDWGLNFSNNLVTIGKGRRLHQEKIVQGSGNPYPVNLPEADWSKQCRNNVMAYVTPLKNWFVVCPARLMREGNMLITEIIKTGSPMGFVIDDPKIVEIQNDRIESYTRAIDDHCSKANYNLVMAILFSKNNSADKYSAIKERTCIRNGIPCQVVTKDLATNQQRMKSCATKVMIQMAAKIGCEPWRLNLPKANWMVCGFDTHHDRKQRNAVGAFVASTNSTFTRYMSSVRQHDSNEEISIDFAMFMMKALKCYRKKNNGNLPTKIFIYRDGIGTGDIERVKNIEVQSVKDAIKNVGSAMNISYNPGLAYIVVSKRINSRFFEKNGSNSYGNPPSGAVVDNTVTLPERFDFFLVSQSVNQGTVSPTSYHVIEDTSKTSPDIHQRLAYGLTHLYYNWAGTLSVPAPCQYAHKLAFLVGEYRIGEKIHEGLEELPYYL